MNQRIIEEILLNYPDIREITDYVNAVESNRTALEIYSATQHLARNKRNIAHELYPECFDFPYLLIRKNTKLAEVYLRLKSAEVSLDWVLSKNLNALKYYTNMGFILVNPNAIRRGCEFIRDDETQIISDILEKHGYKYYWVSLSGVIF